VVCSATTSNRRVILGGAAALFPAIALVPKSSALIIDEEDEDLLSKTKANRASKIKADLAMRNKEKKKIEKVSVDLLPLQKGVYKLAESGSMLSSGDVSAANTILSDSWVSAFKDATLDVSVSDAAKSSVTSVVSGLSSLQEAVKSGSIVDSKKTYVALVASIQTWVVDAGVEGSLKGI
jgi:acyl-CoA hydrolase